MTNRRTTVLQSLTSGFAVAAFLTNFGLAPNALADDQNNHGLPEDAPSVLAMESDAKAQVPVFLGFLIYFGFTKTGGSAAPPKPVAKSHPNYGSLSPISGTLGSNYCLGSSGIAVEPSGRFIYMSGGIGSPGRLCGFAIDPVTQAWTPVEPAGGTPNATGTNPGAVAIDPSGRE